MILQIQFDKIAPYLKDPLVLVGFFIFLVFLLLRIIINKGIIPQLKKDHGYSFLKLVLLYGFLFGIILMGLGFGLKYREMSKAEQQVVLKQLRSELDANTKILNELKLNTEQFLKINLQLSKVLRTEGIPLLKVMFPDVNLDLDSAVNSMQLANSAFDYIVHHELHNNDLEMKRLDAAAGSIVATIEGTLPTFNSLADVSQSRYVFTKSIWNANLAIYRKVHVMDITQFQSIYDELQLIRNDYNIIANSSIHFYKSVADLLDSKQKLTKEKLAATLAVERHTYQLIHDYSINIYNATKVIIDLKSNL